MIQYLGGRCATGSARATSCTAFETLKDPGNPGRDSVSSLTTSGHRLLTKSTEQVCLVPQSHASSKSVSTLMSSALHMATISASVTGRRPASILEMAVRSMSMPRDCSRAASSSWVTLLPERYRNSLIRGPTTFLMTRNIVGGNHCSIVRKTHILCYFGTIPAGEEGGDTHSHWRRWYSCCLAERVYRIAHAYSDTRTRCEHRSPHHQHPCRYPIP